MKELGIETAVAMGASDPRAEGENGRAASYMSIFQDPHAPSMTRWICLCAKIHGPYDRTVHAAELRVAPRSAAVSIQGPMEGQIRFDSHQQLRLACAYSVSKRGEIGHVSSFISTYILTCTMYTGNVTLSGQGLTQTWKTQACCWSRQTQSCCLAQP